MTQSMKAWSLQDGGKEIAKPATVEDLESSLNKLATEPAHSIVDIVSPAGDTLSVGIHGEVACINFIGSSQDPPYLTVLNDQVKSDQGGVVVFRYGGDWTEIPRRNCVPVDVMHRVVKYFFTHETLPDFVRWEQV